MTTPQQFKKRRLTKTWIVLGVALTIGALAAVAARNYLSSQMAAIEAKERGNKINLVVAKRDLKRGEKISSENVAVRPIPADYAHSGAVVPGDFERLEGQTLAFPVKGGEMVLWSLIEGKRAPTFSARVEAGRRAITVPVDEINSISGMLEPGDTIDLIVSADRKGKKVTFPLLQSVQVMATGQRSVDDPKSGERRSYSTVTLDTTPEQAQHVIVAREAGRITALLRNPSDKKTVPSPANLSALLDAETNTRSQPLRVERQVPVLYGGRTGRLPTEGLNLGQYVAAANAAMAAAAAPGDAPAYGAAPSDSAPVLTGLPGQDMNSTPLPVPPPLPVATPTSPNPLSTATR